MTATLFNKIPLNKATLLKSTLASCIGIGVYLVWSLLTLIVISVTSSGGSRSAMLGLYYVIGILVFFLVIFTLVVVIYTRSNAEQVYWIAMLVCTIVTLLCVFIGFCCAPSHIIATFIFSLFSVAGIAVLRFLVVKYMKDVETRPAENSYPDGGDASAYQPPAAVESDSNPNLSSNEPAAII